MSQLLFEKIELQGPDHFLKIMPYLKGPHYGLLITVREEGTTRGWHVAQLLKTDMPASQLVMALQVVALRITDLINGINPDTTITVQPITQIHHTELEKS